MIARYVKYSGLAVFLAAMVTACGGGGSSAPAPAVPSAALGVSTAKLPQGSSVVYSCGCTSQAGTTSVGPGGSIAIARSSVATPASPNPTYTLVPGRNYIVIGTSTTQLQQWSMFFLGNSAATNKYLGSTVDQYETLAALYVYYNSPDALAANSNELSTFDDWNFNTVRAWVTAMRAGSLSATETRALSDIASAQSSSNLLYPAAPNWNLSAQANSTIANDLATIASDGTAVDPNLPTPCPIVGNSAACTNAPTP